MPDAIRAGRASRALCLRMDGGRPASLDETARSVRVIASTEEPAVVWDWERWEPVREVLLMSGCSFPANGQAPLLDSHTRESVDNVLGSFRDMRVEQGATGPRLTGVAVFSATAEDAFRKVAEGHVTDVSIGYEITAAFEIRAGATAEVEGRTLEGPLRVATQWRLYELSLCPIGADEHAKVRAAAAREIHNHPARAGKERAMSLKGKREDAPLGQEEEQKEEETRTARLLRKLRALLGREEQEEKAPEEEREDAPAAEAADDAAVEDVLEELLALADEGPQDGESREDGEKPEEERRKSARARARALVARALGGSAGRSQLAAAGERARISGIREICRAHGLDQAQEDNFINAGVELTSVKAQVYDMLQQRRSQGPGFAVSLGATELEKTRAAIQDALCLRAGLNVEKPAPGADTLRACSLREMAREMVARSGGDARGDIRQIVGRALTTTDLPQLLVETSRRQLMEAYEAAPETWNAWAATGTATDFKKSTAVGFEGDVELKKIPEYGEYAEGRLAENAEEYRIETFGRKLAITRQAIINDDLGALTEVPRLYGEACARLVGDVAYAALLDAGLRMGDGKALFHADHHNLFSGKGDVPTVANLGAVVTGMKTQKDSFGRAITIRPEFFLAGVGLETACEQFFNTTLNGGPVIGDQAQPLVHNPFGGNYFTRIYDRRIDDMGSGKNWLLAARRGTVTVFFLNGVQAPYIESHDNFDTDGFESKVRMDVGAKAMRWVTLALAVKS